MPPQIMLRRLVALALAFCLVLLPAALALADMTLEEERKIGREAYNEVIRAMNLVEDPDCVTYIRDLGAKVASLNPDSPFKFQFFIVDRGDMNAFAIPGGYIFMFRGMMETMDTEGELVAILGHESGHVLNRHLAKRGAKTKGVTMGTLAGMLAGVVLGVLGNAKAGQALTMGSMAGGVQAMMAYSREDEQEADYTGYQLLTKLGYPAQDMIKTFERLYAEQRALVGEIPTYLSTHPASPDRMDSISALARNFPRKVTPHSNTMFLLIKTRLIALYDNEQAAAIKFERWAKDYPKSPFPVYGRALLAMRQLNFRKALGIFTKMAEKNPDSAYIMRERGICLLETGNMQGAQHYLNRALHKLPENATALLALGNSYLQGGRLEQARDTFNRILVFHPKNNEARRQLGVAYGKMGDTPMASLHLGLAFKQDRKYKAARYHLTRAVQTLPDGDGLKEKAKKALKEVDMAENHKLRDKAKREQEEERRRREEERDREEQRRRDGEKSRRDGWPLSR